MQNSIFDIFGNQTAVRRTTSNASKSTHGGGALMRGPVKPNATGPAPKKVLGDLRSNVLCDVGNRNNGLQPSASKGGVKNILSQKDLQCNPGTSFGLKKCIPKKVVPGNKDDETSKPVLLKEKINIPAIASCSQPKLSGDRQEAASCGVGSVFPTHLQLTVEDIEMLGNLTSFCIEPEKFVLPEIFPVEDDELVDPKSYNPYHSAPPFIAWKDSSAVPLPPSE